MKTQYEAITIAVIWVLLGTYILFCKILTKDILDNFSLLVEMAKSDGAMFCFAVTLIKLTELIRLKLFDIITRLALIFVVYVVIYSLLGGPYMLVSFAQLFHRHVLAHFAILFLLLESITYYLQNRYEK
ncbi:hypothetical protein [Larkinella sp. C7]|uniref:hypothetical protein n=1 Tax=Larkinella sp. C7 TaxID=2576607 RepID=UPI00111159D1|nr:hypothetical protein [Larkinella sp. C7]